jgi:hypothetical protein
MGRGDESPRERTLRADFKRSAKAEVMSLEECLAKLRDKSDY